MMSVKYYSPHIGWYTSRVQYFSDSSNQHRYSQCYNIQTCQFGTLQLNFSPLHLVSQILQKQSGRRNILEGQEMQINLHGNLESSIMGYYRYLKVRGFAMQRRRFKKDNTFKAEYENCSQRI